MPMLSYFEGCYMYVHSLLMSLTLFNLMRFWWTFPCNPTSKNCKQYDSPCAHAFALQGVVYICLSASDSTHFAQFNEVLMNLALQLDIVRVRLPWVVYSHPNSRESISTTGDIRRWCFTLAQCRWNRRASGPSTAIGTSTNDRLSP